MSDIFFSSTQSGKTVTAKIIKDGAQIGATVNMIEGTVPGEYHGNMPTGIPTGQYQVCMYYDNAKVGVTQILWSGTREVNTLDLVRPQAITL